MMKSLFLCEGKLFPDKGIGKDIYIFAYGSLLWNPTFEYEEQFQQLFMDFTESFV